MSLNSVYKLNTLRPRTALGLWLCLALCLTLLTNCGKKCQTNTNSVKSLAEARWRLTETNDKNAYFRKLNNYTTSIFAFDNQFRGSVVALVNNEEFNGNPQCKFIYKPAEGQMAVQFSSTTGEGENGEQTTSGCPFSGKIVFDYNVGKNLELTNIKTGVFYKFVQYLGIVEPDKVCTF